MIKRNFLYSWAIAFLTLIACGFDHPEQLAADDSVGAGGKVIATYTVPKLPLAEIQNTKFPGSIQNDHKILLGSVGSDLWHGPGDAKDEFWMITDRGPNGQ